MLAHPPGREALHGVAAEGLGCAAACEEPQGDSREDGGQQGGPDRPPAGRSAPGLFERPFSFPPAFLEPLLSSFVIRGPRRTASSRLRFLLGHLGEAILRAG